MEDTKEEFGEGFKKGFQKGSELTQTDEIEELLLEVYRKLYLIPDELREPLKKLVELLFEQTKEFFPNELAELLTEEEQLERFKGTLEVGILQLLVGMKERKRIETIKGYGG